MLRLQLIAPSDRIRGWLSTEFALEALTNTCNVALGYVLASFGASKEEEGEEEGKKNQEEESQ